MSARVARAPYVARIDLAMDHIDHHLDARLSLDELAADAADRSVLAARAMTSPSRRR